MVGIELINKKKIRGLGAGFVATAVLCMLALGLSACDIAENQAIEVKEFVYVHDERDFIDCAALVKNHSSRKLANASVVFTAYDKRGNVIVSEKAYMTNFAPKEERAAAARLVVKEEAAEITCTVEDISWHPRALLEYRIDENVCWVDVQETVDSSGKSTFSGTLQNRSDDELLWGEFCILLRDKEGNLVYGLNAMTDLYVAAHSERDFTMECWATNPLPRHASYDVYVSNAYMDFDIPDFP